MHLASLFLHPVKSCAPLAVEAAVVEPRGLRHDRRWMVVDEDGRFLTGRQIPGLVRLRATPVEHGLRLQAPDMPALEVPVPDAQASRLAVEVWKDPVDAACAGTAATSWLSQAYGRPLRLVHMDEAAVRTMKPGYSQPGDRVSFADSCPLMAISSAALDGLNARLANPVPMQRFRPNLVIAGCPPHAEDGWRRVRVGAVEFEAAKPCTRCVFTTVDLDRGERDPDGEPLRTLKDYRRGPDGITFGMHLIPRGDGELRVGDAIEVLESA